MVDKKEDFWILALSGGGYRGLYTATILAEMEKRAGVPLATKFDLITGTSVGAALAAGIACEVPTDRLVSMFRNHGREIFSGKRPFFSAWRHWPGLRIFNFGVFSARYSETHLKRLLSASDLLGDTRFGQLKHRLVIPTINLSKGAPQFFKTPHNEKFYLDREVRVVDAVMASAAAPTFFPIYKFNDQRYADGGLVANAPGLTAYHEATRWLNIPPERIHIVTIGTMNSSITVNTASSLNQGLVISLPGWNPFKSWRGWGRRLFEITLAAQEKMMGSMLEHVAKGRVLVVDTEIKSDQSNNVGLDRVNDEAVEVLKAQANIKWQEISNNELLLSWLGHTASAAKMHHSKIKGEQDA